MICNPALWEPTLRMSFPLQSPCPPASGLSLSLLWPGIRNWTLVPEVGSRKQQQTTTNNNKPAPLLWSSRGAGLSSQINREGIGRWFWSEDPAVGSWERQKGLAVGIGHGKQMSLLLCMVRQIFLLMMVLTSLSFCNSHSFTNQYICDYTVIIMLSFFSFYNAKCYVSWVLCILLYNMYINTMS